MRFEGGKDYNEIMQVRMRIRMEVGKEGVFNVINCTSEKDRRRCTVVGPAVPDNPIFTFTFLNKSKSKRRKAQPSYKT